MAMWDPWRGCKKYSEGCKFCYIHKGDKKRGVNTNDIVKLATFDMPIRKKKNGDYIIKPGSTVYLGFSTDFLIKEADSWRADCWKMIRERNDLHFIFLTKRIERFNQCAPKDWNDGYDNVTVGCTVENQYQADQRLSIFSALSIKHKNIICQPLIEKVNIEAYLDNIELVVVGGESDRNARPLDYDWVLEIRQQCLKKNVSFQFRQCGTNFIKEGKKYQIKVSELTKQAKKANIDRIKS